MSELTTAERINKFYDDAVNDLPLEEAIEVAEEVHSYIDAALAGLRADLEAQGNDE